MNEHRNQVPEDVTDAALLSASRLRLYSDEVETLNERLTADVLGSDELAQALNKFTRETAGHLRLRADVLEERTRAVLQRDDQDDQQ